MKTLAADPSLVEALAGVIFKLVDQRVEQRLASVTGAMTGEAIYQTRGGMLPPGCKKPKAMTARLARFAIPSWTEGTGTRAVHFCRAVDWHTSQRQPSKVKPPTLRIVPPSSDEELAASFLAAAGDRPTRVAGGGR